jgi:choline transport protein
MEKSIDLQTLDDELRQRRKNSVSEAKDANDFDRDRYELARAGKQQVLKVSSVQFAVDDSDG